MKGPIVLSLGSVALFMVQTVYGQLYNTSAIMMPPVGNSPQKVIKTVSSYLVYTCVNGAWVRGRGYAALVDETTNKVVGNYTTVVDRQGELGTWTLINSIGDSIESGASASLVTGRPVASSPIGKYGGLPSRLYEAASHQNDGAAASVSYIQQYNISGGLPPPAEKCLTKVYSVTVPMTAEFCLWTQDAVPVSVPVALVSPGRMVEGFFGKGFIDYQHNGSGWVECGKAGTLYSLPGSPAMGKFWEKNGVEAWQLFDPNGFLMYGQRISPEMNVTLNAFPWSLSAITSESGFSMTFGAFSHVQLTSTRGGMAPPVTSKPLLAADVWSAPFSAIFWLYVSG